MVPPAKGGFPLAWILALSGVSGLVLACVLFWTRGTQTRVEARLPELRRLAREFELPLDLLLAACVTEAYEDRGRGDRETAAALREAFEGRGGSPEEVLRAWAGEDAWKRLFCTDLWRRNLGRWRRLAAGER